MILSELQTINVARANRWHPQGVMEWSALEWAGAMAGEVGEAANFAKKLKRLESKLKNIDKRLVSKTSVDLMTQKEIYRIGIADEVADTIIYGILLVEHVGLNIEDSVRKVFNAKSEEYGFPERI